MLSMDSILPRNENSVDRVIRVLVGAAVLSFSVVKLLPGHGYSRLPETRRIVLAQSEAAKSSSKSRS
jgi:hypothetical protein